MLKSNIFCFSIAFKYRNVFSQFPFFNPVQSAVFDDIFYSDENIVISAPTSSGKTVLLELAIIRLLISLNYNSAQPNKSFKIIYSEWKLNLKFDTQHDKLIFFSAFVSLVAPLKALCTEKFNEWTAKFDQSHNVTCIELTGDTDHNTENNASLIENANIICTTPVNHLYTWFALFINRFLSILVFCS